jgi:hypothetical protein
MRFEEGDWSWQAKDNKMILAVRRDCTNKQYYIRGERWRQEEEVTYSLLYLTMMYYQVDYSK